MNSTYKWPLFTFVLFVAYFLFSILIPPFQSPDEYEHVKRAYLLAEGTIILNTPEGQSSGGMIDVGLNSYIEAYKVLIGKPQRKLSADEVSEAKTIQWTGQKVFSPAPGTGYYLPIVYLPQAIGLKTGEVLGLSVEFSYRLARLGGLVAALLLVFLSFRLYSPSPLVLALLVMPMSLFQMASASLDVMSTALAILTMSLFLRLVKMRERTSDGILYGLSICLFFLICSKINLLPLIGLLFVTGLYTKNKKGLVAGAIVLVGVFVWLIVAVKTTVDMRVITGSPTSGIVGFYLKHPLSFFEVLVATIPALGISYVNSFMGVLGWLDTPLPVDAYAWLYSLLFCVLIASISVGPLREQWSARGFLLLCAIASTLLVFFALLVTWNAHPAKIIQGVQGRYFLIPALLLAYALGGGEPIKRSFYSIAGFIALMLMFLVSGYCTSVALLDRYYIQGSQSDPVQIQKQVSPILSPGASISLNFSQKHLNDAMGLKRIGVMFATYVRKNPGEAEIRLSTPEGAVFSQRFALPDLVDNQYRYFDLDPKRYSQGEIVAVTGGGVSLWEAKTQSGLAHTCLIYEYIDGRRVPTVGCPAQDQ